MGATSFVTRKAAHTPVDGLPLESGAGGLDLGHDVASCELGRASSHL